MGQTPHTPKKNENGKSNFERFLECFEKFVERVEACAEGVNKILALVFRLWNAVKDSIIFIAFLVIFIAFVRVVFWIHHTIPFL